MTDDVKTETIHVLVLPTGEAIDLDSIDGNTDFGCDPFNSAERLRPDARYFLQDMRDAKQEVAGREAGLPQHAIDWLANYFKTGEGK